MGQRGAIPALILSLLGVDMGWWEGRGHKGKEGGERAKGWIRWGGAPKSWRRPGLRGGGGWARAGGPTWLQPSARPQRLFGCSRRQSADTGGGGAVRRAPPCAAGPWGPCSHWPALWAARAPAPQ